MKFLNFLVIYNSLILEKIKNFIDYFCNFFSAVSKFKNLIYKICSFDFSEIKSLNLINKMYHSDFCNKLVNGALNRKVNNYYATDVFSKHSKTIAICAANFLLVSF